MRSSHDMVTTGLVAPPMISFGTHPANHETTEQTLPSRGQALMLLHSLGFARDADTNTLEFLQPLLTALPGNIRVQVWLPFGQAIWKNPRTGRSVFEVNCKLHLLGAPERVAVYGIAALFGRAGRPVGLQQEAIGVRLCGCPQAKRGLGLSRPDFTPWQLAEVQRLGNLVQRYNIYLDVSCDWRTVEFWHVEDAPEAEWESRLRTALTSSGFLQEGYSLARIQTGLTLLEEADYDRAIEEMIERYSLSPATVAGVEATLRLALQTVFGNGSG